MLIVTTASQSLRYVMDLFKPNGVLILNQLHQGEISALVNLARTLGGFSVAYFQVPWATKHGALQTFGVEAAIVTGLFILIVPALQYRGRDLRVSRFDIIENGCSALTLVFPASFLFVRRLISRYCL